MNKIYKLSSFLLCLLVSLSVAGCGGLATPTSSVPAAPGAPSVSATQSASPVPAETTADAAVTAGTAAIATARTGAMDTGATYPNYGRASDYIWVAGQLKQQGSCWIVTYVSPLSKSRPDQYNNHFALSPGGSWNPAGVKDGEWAVVWGQPEPGTVPAPGCTAHGYAVTSLQPNPNATGGTATGIYPNYGHAPDYIWVAGQLKQQGSCWIVTYVSPLVDIPADQYNNQFALLRGQGWQPSAVKDGEWVVVQGQPEPGTVPASSCTAHGYNVSSVQPNPNATDSTGPGTYPPFGNAPDFSWIAGQVAVTRIQGGCTFIQYNQAGAGQSASVQPIGQGWSDAVNSGLAKHGAFIVAFGHMAGHEEPAPMCPAPAYVVDRVQIQSNPAP